MTDLARSLAGLPGAELVSAGLVDLAGGTESEAALLVAVGAPRLRRLGLPVPAAAALPDRPELRLYERLCRDQPSGAHGRYRALIRRLVSFEHALELEQARRRRAGG